MRYQLVSLCLLLAFASGGASALKPEPVPAPEADMPTVTQLTFNGKIVYQSLEGGFWGLVDEAGRHYVPEHLAPAFQHDGLRVHVRATLAEKSFGITMWGTRIHLLDINIAGDNP